MRQPQAFRNRRNPFRTVPTDPFDQVRWDFLPAPRGPVDTYNDWVVAKGYWTANPGGESQVEGLRRFLRAFRTILDHPADRIVVVAHGLPIAWLREGIRASVDRASDLGINFKEPGVELATPYRFHRDEVDGAIGVLAGWLARRPG